MGNKLEQLSTREAHSIYVIHQHWSIEFCVDSLKSHKHLLLLPLFFIRKAQTDRLEQRVSVHPANRFNSPQTYCSASSDYYHKKLKLFILIKYFPYLMRFILLSTHIQYILNRHSVHFKLVYTGIVTAIVTCNFK